MYLPNETHRKRDDVIQSMNVPCQNMTYNKKDSVNKMQGTYTVVK